MICEHCNDSGTVAQRRGRYIGPGPVPDGVAEAFCSCDFGQKLLRREVRYFHQRDAEITAHQQAAKETGGDDDRLAYRRSLGLPNRFEDAS